MLTTFDTPNSAFQIRQATDPDGYYMARAATSAGMAINTDQIPSAGRAAVLGGAAGPEVEGPHHHRRRRGGHRLIAYFEDAG